VCFTVDETLQPGNRAKTHNIALQPIAGAVAAGASSHRLALAPPPAERGR
jgi:hypothetical protein